MFFSLDGQFLLRVLYSTLHKHEFREKNGQTGLFVD